MSWFCLFLQHRCIKGFSFILSPSCRLGAWLGRLGISLPRWFDDKGRRSHCRVFPHPRTLHLPALDQDTCFWLWSWHHHQKLSYTRLSSLFLLAPYWRDADGHYLNLISSWMSKACGFLMTTWLLNLKWRKEINFNFERRLGQTQ